MRRSASPRRSRRGPASRSRGARGAYSDFTWDWTCFHGIDWDEATKRNGLWLFDGKQWNESVNTEFGNFDYLMGCDVHVTDPRVSEELDRWGTLVRRDDRRGRAAPGRRQARGLRLLRALARTTCARPRGACCPPSASTGAATCASSRTTWSEVPNVMLFDVPLHYHLHDASVSDGNVDLSRLWENTLTASHPGPVRHLRRKPRHPARPVAGLHGRLLVQGGRLRRSSSSTRPGCPASSGVTSWVPPRPATCPPCVSCRSSWACALRAAIGPQHNAFDDPDVVGFAREGKDGRSPAPGCAVILSDRMAAEKTLYVGRVTRARSGSASSAATRPCASRTTGRSPAPSATVASASTRRAPERITRPGLVHGDEAGERVRTSATPGCRPGRGCVRSDP